MNNLSTWSKTNLLLSSLFLIIAFLAPTLVEKFSYSGKIREAESVVKNIAENQSVIYSTNSAYLSIKKSEQSSLDKKFSKISRGDLKNYDYTITTTRKSFTIVAEPKIDFLRTREVPPKIYTFTHILNGGDTKEWSSL